MISTLLAALLAAAAPGPADPHKDHAGLKHEMPCCAEQAKKDCCKGEKKMDCCEKTKAEAPAPDDHAGHAH